VCIISRVVIVNRPIAYMERKRVLVQTCCLAHLSVGLSVGLSDWRVYCGKTDDWIWMPFGVVSEVGRGIGVLDESGDRRTGSKSFEVNVGHPIVSNGTLWRRHSLP